MSVEFIPASVTRDLTARIERARTRAMEATGEESTADQTYWVGLFEANAAATLEVLDLVSLPADQVVRYCFYGRQQGDLLVRPFVARASTDVTAVRRLVDWHPPPDSAAGALRARPTKDVELLYRHFVFERTPEGYFQYWLAMQELWASARWIHSRIIADGSEFDQINRRAGWHVDREVERYEPAVILEEGGEAQLAVLQYCPLERAGISLQRVHIHSDQAVEFLDAIPVAHGPSGYRFQ